MTEISNEVLLEKIENLTAMMSDVKLTVGRLDSADRQRINDQAKLEAKADAAHRRIDTQAELANTIVKRMEIVEGVIPSMVLAYKIGAFILSGLGLSMIALIWALITGQATIKFGP